jgi:hypothetical protein
LQADKKKRPAKHRFISAYFARFPDFDFDDADETMSQFSELQETCQWSSKQYREEKDALQLALVEQFNQIYGRDAQSIRGWQELCRTLGITPIPATVGECALVS